MCTFLTRILPIHYYLKTLKYMVRVIIFSFEYTILRSYSTTIWPTRLEKY